METIGKRIKYLREKHRISQQQLAVGAGIQRGNISHYEKGDWNPNYETTEKIAAFFSVNTHWLFYGEENKFNNDEVPYLKKQECQSVNTLTENQQKLLEKFETLNYENQIKIIERIDVLLETQNNIIKRGKSSTCQIGKASANKEKNHA